MQSDTPSRPIGDGLDVTGVHHYRVMVVDTDPATSERIALLLDTCSEPSFEITASPPEGEWWLTDHCDVLVLGVDKDQERNLRQLRDVRRVCPHVPVVALNGDGGSAAGRILLQQGAQDYLGRHELSSALLVRTLVNAIERHASSERESGAPGAASAMAAVLDQLPMGVVLLSPRGKVIFQNRSARQTMAGSPEMMVDREGHLRSGHGGSGHALEKAIDAVLHGESGDDPSYALTLGAEHSEQAINVVLTAVGSGARHQGAVVFLSAPSCPIDIDLSVLMSLYGLSSAEARVAAALAKGLRAEEVAQGLHVSLNTIRTHIKQGFRKTGTTRQSELIKMILTGPAVIAPQAVSDTSSGATD